MPDSTCFTIGANNSRRLDFVGHEVVPPMKLSDIIPNASTEAIDLITQLLSWDPSRRPDADQSLQHPFIPVNTRVPRSLSDPFEQKLSNKRAKPNLELKLHDFGPDPDDCFLGLTLAVKPSVSNLDVVQNASRGMGENMLFCSDFNDHSDQSGSFSRSTVNHESGAKSGVSAIVSGIIITCALLFLTPLFESIPQGKYKHRREELTQPASLEGTSAPNELDVWIEVAGIRKGHIYGLWSESSLFASWRNYRGSSSSSIEWVQRHEFEELKLERDELRDMVKQSMESHILEIKFMKMMWLMIMRM
ncbi:cyclin-dependent kinase [Trifolium repens]|nr:cyclin-dependent kinase [Trifolium repens]